MGSTIRKTSAGKEIEGFIDNREKDLSPNLYEALEVLASDVDDIAEELQDENESLKSEIEELKEQLRDAEYERDELQKQLSEVE